MPKKRDCRWLLSSLFALILLSPIVVEWDPWGRLFMSLLMTFILLGGIGVVSDSKRHLLWAVVLLIPALIMQWASHAPHPDPPPIWRVSSFYLGVASRKSLPLH